MAASMGLSPALQNSNVWSDSSSISSKDAALDEGFTQQWSKIERLPTYERSRTCLFDEYDDATTTVAKGKRMTDVRELGALQCHLFVERLIRRIDVDNLRLLQKLRSRIDKVGMQLPAVEVRYKDLYVEAKCKVVDGKPFPTLWNSLKDSMLAIAKLLGSQGQEAKISILQNVNGVIKPGKLTLLLGPPGCGKTSLLLALSGNMSKSLKVSGDVTYNGYKLDELVPQKNSVYVRQHDLHIPNITVRETLDFAAHCQGVGSRAEIMTELCRREKQAGIVPDPDIDVYMKGISTQGLKRTLQTDYVLKILGLDTCANTMVGDDMQRGISGGQKKRLTTGSNATEMIVGPTKVLLMDEITNGLDSSTAFQLVSCIQQRVHLTDATALVSLLQPAPECFELFDDIMLMAEGKIVYHGPRLFVLDFFEECGFRCPQRKGVADFLQEVISKKDQQQYWFHHDQPYRYFSVDTFCEKFKASTVGKKLYEEVSCPYVKSESDRNAISFHVYSLSNWNLFKACSSREYLLMKRNLFTYAFKTTQMVILARVTMTVFLRTQLGVDVVHAYNYLGALTFGLIILVVDGLPEASQNIMKLPVFNKHRDLKPYPAWACPISTVILKITLSVVISFAWTSLTYYSIGYSPEPGRFFRQFLLLGSLHFVSLSMLRFLAALCQTIVAVMLAGNLVISTFFVLSGCLIPRSSMPAWLKWAFWVSPFSYAEIGLSVNEFRAPRWQKVNLLNRTIGHQILEANGLDFPDYYYWISVGVLIGFAILFNIGYTLALTFLKAPGGAAVISRGKLSRLQGVEDPSIDSPLNEERKSWPQKGGRRVLPFQPLTLSFKNVNFYVGAPTGHGLTKKKLQLLRDITGVLRPGVLTALMGASGAGKTTLLDVLSGRKTIGSIEGDIRVSGFPKVQEAFARVSGYCEQTDIHSPQITVEESVVFSAWLHLPDGIDPQTKIEFVNEVLETIELDNIKDAIVGVAGVSGLSTEERKRLTVAVELVSNPSIIFMDEHTTGLDARAAAIVMRAVKNVAATGRTAVCTIHQPSIDIFEALDELILLKTGGQVIYSGPLGQNSRNVIEYFEGITGVPKIRDNYNPATWMLEVTSTSAEAGLGLDFAQAYENSMLIMHTRELVKDHGTPLVGSKDILFQTTFSQNGWGQFKYCLWKQHLSYWRSPSYNLVRLVHTLISSLVFGLLFWNQGGNLKNQQSLLTVLASMYAAVIFLGISNCSNVLPIVDAERNVVYRERFAGMYSSWAYSFAQVAVEVPYLLTEALIFTSITYPMIGFYLSAYKVFWYCYAMFSTLMYFNFMGLMLISMTPNSRLASVISAACYAMFSLFAGFLIPGPRIPKWWIWMYYVCPTSWSLRGMLTSQYGDIKTEIMVFGKAKTVVGFLDDYLGFSQDQLGLVAVILMVFPLAFASLFAIFMGKLNFQMR